MKKVCAWCKKDCGEVEPFEDGSITHGICNECREKSPEELNTMISTADTEKQKEVDALIEKQGQ